MKQMLWTNLILGLLFSCGKEMPASYNITGKWSLVSYELYQQDSLTGSHVPEELSTIYYFSDCISESSAGCEMYIEEDGEKNYHSYVMNDADQTLVLDGSSEFSVSLMDDNQLVLERSFETYESTYRFVKAD